VRAARTVEVPANAGFVIEGYVDPREPLRDEGPFGDRCQVRSPNFEVRMSGRRSGLVKS
jgi:UbiD family decarboxylase